MPETKPDALMAYCGIDCSKCFGYTKTVSEAAKQLRRTMRAEKIKRRPCLFLVTTMFLKRT